LLEVLIVDFLLYMMTRPGLVWKRSHRLWTLMLPLILLMKIAFLESSGIEWVLLNIEGFIQVQLQQR